MNTHSKAIGYILWIFGFMDTHRFYYGRPVTGTIWFFTLARKPGTDHGFQWR